MDSKIKNIIQESKVRNGDCLADAIIDLCFVTSYKIEDLLIMPPKRLNRLLDRFSERFLGGTLNNG